MALLAVKHLDPVVGVDVHSVLVTPGTPPVFLPHPHVGFMLDKREYIQAAKAVVGCIATMIAQEKVTEYIEHHPEDVTKLEHLADEANQQVNDLMGGGKLPDTVVEGIKLAKEANKIKSRISDDLGSNVGSGGGSGRPIFVNGMMRATAGTHAYHVPGLHFPLGESFAPPPEEVEPSNDGESFMGSKTVLANNDPMSYMALEALSCWSIGMEPPPHNSAHTDRTYPSMPSSVMLPIPAGRPVLVGGPPIMNMAAAAKGLFKAFRGSKWAKALADKLHLKPGFLRCNVLKAEPVDATTGEVVVQQSDFTVSGRLPLVWERHYSSQNLYHGAVGVGWQTPADIRIELIPHDGDTGAVAFFPDHSTAFDILPEIDGWPARVYDWQYGYALYKLGNRLTLRTREGIEYEFVLPKQRLQAVGMLDGKVRLTVPIARIADLNGNAWVFERDASQRVVRIAEWTLDGISARAVECGRRDETYDGVHVAGHLQALTMIAADGSAHPLVSYEHDRMHNLRAAVDAMAKPHRFDYTDDHRMVSHASPRGVSFYYSYCYGDDGVWRVERAWGDEGLFDYRFSYDTARMETRIADSLGYITVLQLNEQRMPVAEVDPLGGVTGYQYDMQGRTNARTDPAGRIVRWDYDKHGNLVTQTQPDGSEIRIQYDADQRPLSVRLSGGRQWSYEWDTQGNLLVQTMPSGAKSCYAYDAYGQPVEHVGPRGALTTFEYDRTGNLRALTDALGHHTRYRHDVHGNLVEMIDALGRSSRYEYDRNGNMVKAIEPGGHEVHCTYDSEGNLTRYRDPAGHVTRMEYSALGQISRRHSPDGTVVEYRYDTEDQFIGFVNERGELYALERDALGRISAETDYWGQTRKYRYGLAGDLLASTDPLGQVVRYRYDRLGRLVEKQAPHPERADDIWIERFSYDTRGDLVLAENPSCRVSFQYDADGKVVEERQGDDFTIANTYDTAGNRTERITTLVAGCDVVQHAVRYSYDALNAAISIQIDDTTPIVLERDELGQVRIEHLSAVLRRDLSYEASNELASQRTLLAGTGVLFASEYAYDANGELVEKRDSRTGTERFQYDPVGQITAHIDPMGRLCQFLRDPVGDLSRMHIRERRPAWTTQTTPANTWVREGEYGGCHYAYDRAGNLIRRDEFEQELALKWSSLGQLVETVTIKTAEAETERSNVLAQYEYDPFQRRVRKIVHAESTTGAAPSRISCFFWDGDTLVAEYTTGPSGEGRATPPHAGDEKHAADVCLPDHCCTDAGSAFGPRCSYQWVYYPQTFRPLAMVRNTLEATEMPSPAAGQASSDRGAVYLYQNDPNGAPVRMHDLKGHVVWEARYSATGDTARFGPNEIEQPIRLLGQYHDNESNLNYNRYRYFDPYIAQFISQDPIGLLGGTNLYQYAPNPIGWIDPLGLKCSYLRTNSDGTTTLMIKDKFAAGSAESNQLRSFITAWNAEIAKTKSKSMTKRGPLKSHEEQYSESWKRWIRSKNPTKYSGKVVGHTPDAIMGGPVAYGTPTPLDTSVNSYLGGVAGGVPTGTVYHSVDVY